VRADLLLAGVGMPHERWSGWGGAADQPRCSSVLRRRWFGGLLPFIYCLRLAHGRWRQAAIGTMMRFSRYGHLAVAGVIASGVINALMIQGDYFASPWGRMLLFKCALVAGWW
jgi:putative copper resistance protein D